MAVKKKAKSTAAKEKTVIDKKTGKVRRKSAEAQVAGKKAASKLRNKPKSAAHKLAIAKAMRLVSRTGKTKSGRVALAPGRKPAGKPATFQRKRTAGGSVKPAAKAAGKKAAAAKAPAKKAPKAAAKPAAKPAAKKAAAKPAAKAPAKKAPKAAAKPAAKAPKAAAKKTAKKTAKPAAKAPKAAPKAAKKTASKPAAKAPAKKARKM